MKKIVKILAIVLACALCAAAFVAALKFAKDNADDEPAETTDMSIIEPSVEIITFTICEIETFLYRVYTCEKGMTWKDFFESEYNTDRITYMEEEATGSLIINHSVFDGDFMLSVFEDSDDTCYLADEIVEDCLYICK